MMRLNSPSHFSTRRKMLAARRQSLFGSGREPAQGDPFNLVVGTDS